MSDELDPTRARVLSLLQRHGREPTSFQMLEPGHAYWFDADEACIAYADVGRAWVTVGEPLCAPERTGEVIASFEAAARAAGKRVRYFHVGQAFVHMGRLSATHVGEQPLWNPEVWPETLRRSKSLREQLRRARAKGVTTRVVDADEMRRLDGRMRIECEALIRRWLASRRMDEMKFMVLVHPFELPDERRYVVAEQEGAVVGFAAAVPIYAKRGWFVEDLLRDPIAPNGTAELLVDGMMRLLATEGSTYVTLGLAPLSGDVGRVLSWTRDTTARLYNFGGVRAFKEKLLPETWEPVYVAYPRGELGLFAMGDVLRAFAPGGLVRFGLNTLVHQRTLATALLAIGLVPWTLALATVHTETWFPSTLVQRAWTAFDALLIVILFSLVHRWRTWVAELASVLTVCDALLTTLQVLAWNVWTARTPAAWLLVVIGCVGPLLASAFFWTTRRLSMRTKVRLQPR